MPLKIGIIPPHANKVRETTLTLEMPAHPKRKISRTWRMQTLPAGIYPPLGYGQKADTKHSQRRLIQPNLPG